MDEKAERRAIVEEAVREEQQFREMKKQHLAAEASRVRDVREEEKLEEVKRAEMRAMMDDLHAYEQKFDGRQSATDGASGDDDGGDGDDGDPLRATLAAGDGRASLLRKKRPKLSEHEKREKAYDEWHKRKRIEARARREQLMTALIRAEKQRERRIEERRVALRERKRREKREQTELKRARAAGLVGRKSGAKKPRKGRHSQLGPNPYVLGGGADGFLPPVRSAVHLRDVAHERAARDHVDGDDGLAEDMRERSFEQAFLPSIVVKEQGYANASKKKLADRAKKRGRMAASASFPKLPHDSLAFEQSAIERELQQAIGIFR